MEPQEVERRLTTILAADIVGYSRLMGLDEAGTLSAITKHRDDLIDPKAAQYGGRIVKHMGDGTLMEFASVVDAVAFAVDVQCAMKERNTEVLEDRQIAYRIGINVGDIIVKGDVGLTAPLAKLVIRSANSVTFEGRVNVDVFSWS